MSPKKKKRKSKSLPEAESNIPSQPPKTRDEVQSHQNAEADESTRAYWTPERRAAAKPLPLPNVDPSRIKRRDQSQETSGAGEVVRDPVGPDESGRE